MFPVRRLRPFAGIRAQIMMSFSGLPRRRENANVSMMSFAADSYRNSLMRQSLIRIRTLVEPLKNSARFSAV